MGTSVPYPSLLPPTELRPLQMLGSHQTFVAPRSWCDCMDTMHTAHRRVCTRDRTWCPVLALCIREPGPTPRARDTVPQIPGILEISYKMATKPVGRLWRHLYYLNFLRYGLFPFLPFLQVQWSLILQSLSLRLTEWVTLAGYINEAQLPHLWNGGDTRALLPRPLWALKEITLYPTSIVLQSGKKKF